MKSRELLHYLCNRCLDALNPQLPRDCTAPSSSTIPPGPLLVPRESQEMPQGQEHLLYRERLKLPQRKFHLHMRGETSGTNSSWFPFSPPHASQGFYLSSADGKAGRERAEPVTSSQQMLLRHRIPRCPGGICAEGPMDNSCLTAGRAPGQPAVGSSTAQPTAACQPCHRATLHPGSIRSWAVPGPRALGMIQQQEVLDNRLSPQQSYSSCFHKPQEQL